MQFHLNRHMPARTYQSRHKLVHRPSNFRWSTNSSGLIVQQTHFSFFNHKSKSFTLPHHTPSHVPLSGDLCCTSSTAWCLLPASRTPLLLILHLILILLYHYLLHHHLLPPRLLLYPLFLFFSFSSSFCPLLPLLVSCYILMYRYWYINTC